MRPHPLQQRRLAVANVATDFDERRAVPRMRAFASQDTLTFSNWCASIAFSSFAVAGANCFRATFPFELFASISMYQPSKCSPALGSMLSEEKIASFAP